MKYEKYICIHRGIWSGRHFRTGEHNDNLDGPKYLEEVTARESVRAPGYLVVDGYEVNSHGRFQCFKSECFVRFDLSEITAVLSEANQK